MLAFLCAIWQRMNCRRDPRQPGVWLIGPRRFPRLRLKARRRNRLLVVPSGAKLVEGRRS